mmetsp:Transcript_24578/g.97028  ORF Transcript_24578/g.97028 Transcript_24578/m.97028 type:complete len:89 (-) Transcript_24578:1281-1547(-)
MQGFEYKYDGQASVRPMTIAPDGDGGLVMSGIFYDTPEVGNQFYVASFSAKGAMKWCASDGVDGYGYAALLGMMITLPERMRPEECMS